MVPPLITWVLGGGIALAGGGTGVGQVSLLRGGGGGVEAQTQTELPELPGQK